MTAINCLLSPTFVAVATDTLVTDVVDWGPFGFTPKAHFLPQVQGLVTATGTRKLLGAALVTAEMVSPANVRDLARLLPSSLRQAHSTYSDIARAIHPDDDHEYERGARLRLFGWDEEQERFVGFEMAQPADFEPVEMADGPFMTPETRGVQNEDIRTPIDLCRLTALQQHEELLKTPGDRNAIGGDLLLYVLTRGSDGRVVGQVSRQGRFDTYAADSAEIQLKISDRAGDLEARRQLRAPQWDRWKDTFAKALQCGDGTKTLADVEAGFLAGRYDLIETEKRTAGALVEQVSDGRFLHVFLLGGVLSEVLGPLRTRLESIAKLIGCQGIGLAGRRGWVRPLAPYGYRLVDRNWWVVMKDVAGTSIGL